jgi:aldose 1-epimerase
MLRHAVYSLGSLLLFTLAAAAADPKAPSIEKQAYGKLPDGTPIDAYVLTNAHGMQAKVITYGGLLTELRVPNKSGRAADVVLGFDNLEGYLKGHPYFGSNVGRVANRIAKGKFTLDGKEYTLAINNGPNALHGGEKGFDKQVWKAEPLESKNGPAVRFTYQSKDGEEGYPGNLTATATYTLTEDNGLRIDYTATTDKSTPVNLAHHTYFNLGGQDAGSILDHVLWIDADKYTPTDETLIPTGELKDVKGTPLDFTQPTPIGKRIDQLKGKGLPGGYDHNYVLNGGETKEPRVVVRVKDPKSGRVMEVLTTQPGVQLYTGNFLSGKEKGKSGAVYQQHHAFCLEAQHFPDSVNHADFPSTILKPGETYKQTTIYRFKAE